MHCHHQMAVFLIHNAIQHLIWTLLSSFQQAAEELLSPLRLRTGGPTSGSVAGLLIMALTFIDGKTKTSL
ncbi:unnamed protein product [Knipowitschia caucasica]